MAFDTVRKSLTRFLANNGKNLKNASGIIRGEHCFHLVFNGELQRGTYFSSYSSVYNTLRKMQRGEV